MAQTPPSMQTGDVIHETVEAQMSLDEARAILAGDAPMLAATGQDVEVTMCGDCGVMIGHRATHVRHHLALGVVAAYLDTITTDADGRPV